MAFVPLRPRPSQLSTGSASHRRFSALDPTMMASHYARYLNIYRNSGPLHSFRKPSVLTVRSNGSGGINKKYVPPPPPAPQQGAERLNLYIDRHDGETRMLEQIDEEPNGTFRAETRTRKERWKRNIRIVVPHIGLVILSALYTIFGATVFHHIEQPYEMQIRNDTSQRVHALKRRIIAQLWTIVHDNTTNIPFDDWSEVAHTGMNMVIKDVFIDYTKNYMLPEDIINGTGPMKWSLGSSIFFSWTCITTIGYGHIVPRTLEGRIFCLGYALIGIPLILVTIADLGRFLSAWKKRKRQSTTDGQTSTDRKPTLNHFPGSRKFVKKRIPADQVSEAGTFEDISEIHTHESSEKSSSEDTKARADDVEEYEPIQQEHRVSLIFILVIMLLYTSGGACLMQLWERWNFMDAFYFCFVTVTTIGFGDIVPMNSDFMPVTLAYIVFGLIITTMCIDLVGSEYILRVHSYGRSIGRNFLTIGGKVVHLGEVFSYVAFLQKNYGLTPDQLDKLAQLPEEYLLDCLINGRQPDLNWIGGRPYIPPDIFYFKWIEQPRTLSFTSSERLLASVESLDLNTSRCSTARTMTPREYYHRFLLQYAKQMHPLPEAGIVTADREDRKHSNVHKGKEKQSQE